MIKHFREPVNGLTHFFGAVGALIGTIFLILNASSTPGANVITVIAVIVFGISMIFLYSASTIYHLTKAKASVILRLRKLDHSMIYVLIAGTYTPAILLALTGTLKWGFFIGVWAIALAGIIVKMFWIASPRWLNAGLYVAMGWSGMAAIVPLYNSIGGGGIVWLLAGGIAYTVGAVIYATKRPLLVKEFGFHEIFHIFVIIGSICHYVMVMKYIIPMS